MGRQYEESEDEPDANTYKYEDSKKRDEEYDISIRRRMIESILESAKLCEHLPITNCFDQSNEFQISCEIGDETLTRLNQIYPIQKLVWPHILNKRSTILIGNTDYYPHLLYLPAVCDLIKVIYVFTLNEFQVINTMFFFLN